MAFYFFSTFASYLFWSLLLRAFSEVRYLNFYSIVTIGVIQISAFLTYFLWRDRKNPGLFFGKHKKITTAALIIIIFTATLSFYVRFIEPERIQVKKVDFSANTGTKPVKIVFLADLQLTYYSGDYWIKKITAEVKRLKPDIIILGGDIIDNEGWSYQPIVNGGRMYVDEVDFLHALAPLTEAFPTYYIFGNHEYGLGTDNRTNSIYWTGDRSAEVAQTLNSIGAKSLNNILTCPENNGGKVCFFGIDDLWGGKTSFDALKKWTTSTPLIFVTHNPDGILQWPSDLKKPDLTLAGHTHGGQVYLPFIGPLASAGVELGREYYRGLNYYNGSPIYTSVGLGTSGGPVRLLSTPEITVITISNKK